MYLLYEDDGDVKAGRILSENEASLQVEAASGKRSKIKRANAFFAFDGPEPDVLMEQARAMAQEIDLDFLWECAPQEEFEVPALAAEYFGHDPSPVEKAALLLRVHGAPAYFHRRGKGVYRPAPPDILAAALAALEKKRKQAEQQQQWVSEMAEGRLPEPIAAAALSLLVKPDKNSLQWKALDAACTQLQKSPDRLLLDLGAWPHALALHKQRFLATYFPQGTGFPEIDLPAIDLGELPLSDVEAYSVDDVTTTEIDDALSVAVQPDGRIRIGVHVAAPVGRAGLGRRAGKPARPAGARAHVHGLYAGRQDPHAARCPDRRLLAGCRPRGPGGVAVCRRRPVKRGDPRVADRARAHRRARKPAPWRPG